MAEQKDATLGLLDLTDGRTALLVARAPSSPAPDAEPLPRARREERAASSGGVTVYTEHDMPSLEALLEAHKVKSAVLIRDTTQASGTPAAPAPTRSWREQAEDRLALNLERAAREEPMEEDLVFLAALRDEDLDLFLQQAHQLLAASFATPEKWRRFLQRQARSAYVALGHRPLAPLDTQAEAPLPVEEEREPMFTLNDLTVKFRRGAIGGPRPLAARASD